MKKIRFTYVFSSLTSGLAVVTNIWTSLTFALLGGGEPCRNNGMQSLVGLDCCNMSCGITKLVGRLGDFGDLAPLLSINDFPAFT